MSEFLATTPALPGEAPTVEGRLADLLENSVVSVDEYKLSDHDRARVVAALRMADSGRTEAEVRGSRPRWQPARLMRGDTVLAEISWDDDSGFWNAICFSGDAYMPRLGTYHDTFDGAVASAEKMVRERGL